MNDDKTFASESMSNDNEEGTQNEGSKGGESYFTTWYEFESDNKENDEDEHL